jgi:hypothetical protein
MRARRGCSTFFSWCVFFVEKCDLLPYFTFYARFFKRKRLGALGGVCDPERLTAQNRNFGVLGPARAARRQVAVRAGYVARVSLSEVWR